jgi:hypothetical protein
VICLIAGFDRLKLGKSMLSEPWVFGFSYVSTKEFLNFYIFVEKHHDEGPKCWGPYPSERTLPCTKRQGRPFLKTMKGRNITKILLCKNIFE